MDGQQLQNYVIGQVIAPTDPAYDTTRRAWNLTMDHHPALILAAANAQDVAAGVRFARERGLGVAVQTTGHGIHQPADDNLLIVMTRLNTVQVDPAARMARVGGGTIWWQVVEAVVPHGLAPLLGSSPHVGVTGYTLGGGIGWLARKYGLAADSVREIEVVTPDGLLRHASASSNADLFWGLRGGGGNFGVVTALEFDLYPVAELFGGNMVYPGALASEALRFFRDWVKDAPDELTSSIQVMNFPNLPFLPETMRGQQQVIVRFAYVGNAHEGAGYLQQWLDWNTPLNHSFRVLPFSEIATISNDPVDPAGGYSTNELFTELSAAAIDVIVRHAMDESSPLVFHELRHAGGAISRVPADANAIGNRDAQFYFTTGGPTFGRDVKAAMAERFARLRAELAPYVSGGGYLNFMSGSQAIDRAQAGYLPESFRRLQALKAKYDPDNLFRFSYQLVTAETVERVGA